MRVGEAQNPGPCHVASSDEEFCTFHLGTANVAGLANKVDQFASLPQGIWGLTETHLTQDGIIASTRAIGAQARRDHRHVRVVPGAPVAPRVQDSLSGTWAGVMVCSDYPTRKLNIPWRGMEFDSGRALIVTSYVQQFALTGAVLHGAAQGPTYNNPLKITEDLLCTVTEEVVDGLKGPRYVMGDLNVSLDQLPQFEYWRSHGWRELQVHAHETWAAPLQPTCKMSTIRDYVWASPELLNMLMDVQVQHFTFPDHSVVMGSFRCPSSLRMLRYWSMPHTIPWEQVNTEAWRSMCNEQHVPFAWTDDHDRDFQRWSGQVENSLQGYVRTDDQRLPAGCGGRGQIGRMRRGKPQLPVMKPAREGEVQLRSHLCALPVQRWYKQVRRLQALLHGLRNGVASPGAWTYQATCWSSIIRATGFRGGFRQWWLERPLRLQGSVHTLPVSLPSLAQMELIYRDFLMNFRRFESWNLKQRMRVLQSKRESFAKELFKPLKEDAPCSLDSLQKKVDLEIIEIHPATGKCLLSGPLLSTKEATLHGERIELEPCHPPVGLDGHHWVCFDSDRLPNIGMNLHQSIALSEPAEIEKELLGLWLPRWQNDQHLDEQKWLRILAFARDFMPRYVIETPAIHHDDLLGLLRSGKGLRTRGPDGWASRDFLELPECHMKDLTQLLLRIESVGDWPMQLVRGHVHCLEKSPGADEASQFRPVVLFSLLYRMWGSLRSRYLLQCFSQMADFHAFGFLKERSCQQATYMVMAMVENALRLNAPKSGFLTDIVKCFNYLPRRPLQQLALQLGVGKDILHGWQSFLDTMTRSFIIQNAAGDAYRSWAGYPEGDSMSCVAMVIADFCYHHYMAFYRPTWTCISFVDNLEGYGDSASEAVMAFLTTETWADTLGLRLDKKKTCFWSTSPDQRHLLKNYGVQVVEEASDLGASMQFGAQHRHQHMQSRLKAVNPYWMKLRKMRCSDWHKRWAVRSALLPRALHNSSHVVLGLHWFNKLRSGIMKGLKFNRAGANPMIRLSLLCEIDTDPGFFDFWRTLKDFFAYVIQNDHNFALWRSYCSHTGRRTYGPFAKITQLLWTFGWCIDSDGVLIILDRLRLDLHSCDLGTLRFLAEDAWRQHVAQSVVHRQDMTDLRGIDYEASCLAFVPDDRSAGELLNCIRDGTFFLNEIKCKFDPEYSGLCEHCGQWDSLAHRALHCSFFEEVRVSFDDCISLWSSTTIACSHHGLVNANRWQLDFWDCLLEEASAPVTWLSVPTGLETQMIFY